MAASQLKRLITYVTVILFLNCLQCSCGYELRIAQYAMPDKAYATANCQRGNPEWQAVGRDPTLIHAIAAHTNTLENCTPGDLAFLDGGYFDLYAEAVYWNEGGMDNFQYLYPHVRNNLCALVHRAGVFQRTIFDAFEPAVWCTTTAFLLLFAAALKLAFRMNTERALLESVRTFVTGCHDNQHGCLMIFATVFSLVMLNSFSGTFTSFLTVPKMLPEIDTLEQLKREVKYVRVHYLIYDMVINKNNSALDGLHYSYDLETFDNDLMSRRLAYVSSEEDLERFRRDKRYLEDGISYLRKVPECLWSPAYQSFAVRKDWPLADRYSALVQRLLEGGIVSKMHDDAFIQSTEHIYVRHIDPPLFTEPQVLSLRHFREAFLLLEVGLVAATLSFFAEVVKRYHIDIARIMASTWRRCVHGAWRLRLRLFSKRTGGVTQKAQTSEIRNV